MLFDEQIKPKGKMSQTVDKSFSLAQNSHRPDNRTVTTSAREHHPSKNAKNMSVEDYNSNIATARIR